jgi:cobalt/nickel transport protein
MKYLYYVALAIAVPLGIITYTIGINNGLITLPDETKILVYSLMAGIGAGTLGHFLGARRGLKFKGSSLNRDPKRKSGFELKYLKYLAIILAVAVILVIPFAVNSGARFSGTDGQGPDAISQSGYTPWIQPLGYVPDQLGQTIIFSLQVSIGAIILGYFVGYYRAKGF